MYVGSKDKIAMSALLLSNAVFGRISGDRSQNIERAIELMITPLEHYVVATNPVQFAKANQRYGECSQRPRFIIIVLSLSLSYHYHYLIIIIILSLSFSYHYHFLIIIIVLSLSLSHHYHYLIIIIVLSLSLSYHYLIIIIIPLC